MPTEAATGLDVDGPVPADIGVMARDPLWYAFGLGQDAPAETPASAAEPVSEATSGPLPPSARLDRRSPLPSGTVDLLGSVRYPTGRVGRRRDMDVEVPIDRLGHALVTAFGLQRREPTNPFNDHRSYASVRSKFPVLACLRDGTRRQVLDVYRHALLDLGTPVANGHRRPAVGRQIQLAGRYTRLPSVYRWFRGSLVNLELGINMRALCIGLELFGLPGRLRLPGAGAHLLLSDLGLVPTWEWALPVTVEIASQSPRQRAPDWPPLAEQAPAEHPPDGSDPVLADVVAMNRAQAFDVPAAPLESAIPTGCSPAQLSWAELLWRRTSGGMPRGMYGMAGLRRRLPGSALHDAVAWLAVPPPGELLGAALRAVTVTVVVQAVDGYADGVYRITDGALALHRPDPAAAAALEACYGYPLAPGNGCDVRHASMLSFFSVRPRELTAQFGPGGWTLAQYACGWASHGLGLAAAAHRLYARPARAFEEVRARPILDLDPDEMIVIAVVAGTPRHRGPALDLRL
jgi:hypothetical protein